MIDTLFIIKNVVSILIIGILLYLAYVFWKLGIIGVRGVSDGIEKDKHFWIDKNNNRWDCNKFTRDRAVIYSRSLSNCSSCVDCKYCYACWNCINCKDCIECKGCLNCDNCICCRNCTDCKSLKNSDCRMDIKRTTRITTERRSTGGSVRRRSGRQHGN